MNALGLPLDTAAENARYYALIDLKTVAEAAHGKEFAEWLCKEVGTLDFLEQLSRKYGAVLMYGPGFDGPSDSVRVSLANLNEEDYIELAERIESLLDDLYETYRK